MPEHVAMALLPVAEHTALVLKLELNRGVWLFFVLIILYGLAFGFKSCLPAEFVG